MSELYFTLFYSLDIFFFFINCNLFKYYITCDDAKTGDVILNTE